MSALFRQLISSATRRLDENPKLSNFVPPPLLSSRIGDHRIGEAAKAMETRSRAA
jgi:hypothetical protein